MTSANERRQVLDMLAEGKISADDAQRLLEKLDSAHNADGEASGSAGENAASSESMVKTAVLVSPSEVAKGPKSPRKSMPRYLRILITSKDGEEVNIRIPLQLVRAGVKLVTVLPTEAREQLAANGVDLDKLNELDGDALIDALRELSINVDSSKGEKVRIFCE